MPVLSLELCKELYGLSGWFDQEESYLMNTATGDGFLYDGRSWKTGEWKLIPAYDLGYLLRKLPPEIEWDGYDTRLTLVADHKNWHIGYQNRHRHWMVDKRADTPENACAQLCIKLFKRGILTREDKG